ncbi:hypothetical protein Ocin01_11437 [Orchesella cincta]|uniref:Transmembrane protein n=1 Tax=Orchesella cincta TaxID=48709 RepID=A0A1D2MQG0_ORCCI|nr:hypothetical protein Ocin01_11437 [Orchesella cincta]
MVGPQHAEQVEWLYLNSCTNLRTTANRESRNQTHSRTTTQVHKTCSRDGRNKDEKNSQPARSSHSINKQEALDGDPKSTHNIRAKKAFKKVCSSLLLPVEELRGDKVDKNDSSPSIGSGELIYHPHDPVKCREEFLEKLHRLVGKETNSGKHEMSGDGETIGANKATKPVRKADTSTSTPALKSASTQSQSVADNEEETEDEEKVPIKSKVQSTGAQLAVAGIVLFFFFCVMKAVTKR